MPLALQIENSLPKWLCFILKFFYFQSSSCPYIHYLLCPIHLDSSNILERQAIFFPDVWLPYQKARQQALVNLCLAKFVFRYFPNPCLETSCIRIKKRKTIHFTHTLGRSSLFFNPWLKMVYSCIFCQSSSCSFSVLMLQDCSG